MKFKNILIISCLLPALFSCESDMDYNEITGTYNKEQVFSSFSRTAEFVTNIYSWLDYDFGNYGGAMLASATDEADYVWTASSVHDFYNGSWSPMNPKANVWNSSYIAIRSANFYLEACVGQTFEENRYDKDYEDQMKRFLRYEYEVRFLRAYYYFLLARNYGDVPLTTKTMTAAEANKMAKTPANEIFDFIAQECDAIADKLPVRYDNMFNSETGRAGRIAVLALKARALLYKASPLFNAKDSRLWKAAAEANLAVIKEAAGNGISLGKYTDLWGTESYKAAEGIFMRRIGDLNYLEGYNYPVGVEGGRSGNCPTQTLVDAYEMKSTGKLWNEDGSGFDPANPYNNRDPRLAMTIAKNGDEKWPAYNSKPLETFAGGANGSPLPGASTTGYYLKKYLDPSVDLRPNSSNSKRHTWITFRLGEFYLNYAESVYNYLGSADATDSDFSLSAREAVNVIRGRTGVGMPDFPVGLSNDDFEKRYMNERMVELAFEGHRFYDVRRWKKGELFKKVTCLQITKDATGKLTYTRTEKQRAWDDKMYFYPIPDSERRKNQNLGQNPGW